MSVLSLDATRALLEAKGIRYKMQISPYTGQMAVYAENTSLATVPTSATIDTQAVISKINADLASNSVDGNCDYVGFIGMTLSKSYYPRIWVNTVATSDGQLMSYDANRRLLTPAVIAVIIILALAASLAITTYLLTYMWDHSFTYYDPNSQNYKTIIGETNFVSTMNALYWYTCPKDGTGVGLKSKYPTLASYQASPEYASEQAYLKDHCASAKDIINLNDWTGTIILIAIALGGIYVVVKILPSILSRKGD